MAARLCIVAGVGPGMGMAIARRFGREGLRVALVARNRAALDSHVADLAAQGIAAAAYPADLSDVAATRDVFARILADHGPAEVLVHNAAIWREAKASEVDPALFAADLTLGVVSAAIAAQAVYPAMKERGAGSILATGGGLALHPAYGTAVPTLTAAKSALRGFVHAFAGEAKADGIHVGMVTIAGVVAPGTAFDPDVIADHYWRLHTQAPGAWEVETVFDGSAG